MAFKKTKKTAKNFIGSIEGDLNDFSNKIDKFATDITTNPLGTLSNLFDQRIAGGLEDLLQGFTGIRTSNIPEISAEVLESRKQASELRAQKLNELTSLLGQGKGSANPFKESSGAQDRINLIFPESYELEDGSRGPIPSYVYFRTLPRVQNVDSEGKNIKNIGNLANIFLYVPDTLNDNLSVSYEEADSGITEAISAFFIPGKQQMGYKPEEISQNITDSLPGSAVVKQTFGKTVNPKKFQVFSGVPFRTFDYTFTLRPKNLSEAAMIKDIIYSFKISALPGTLGANSRIYTFPNEWQIQFVGPIADHIEFPLNSVCTAVNVDYGGGQGYTALEDGMPAAISLTLSFVETTTLTRAKYETNVSPLRDRSMNNERTLQGLEAPGTNEPENTEAEETKKKPFSAKSRKAARHGGNADKDFSFLEFFGLNKGPSNNPRSRVNRRNRSKGG